MADIQPISALCRFYIYAIHGFVTEVLFTAAWEFVVNQNWKFPGNTSVWALFIYGISTFVIEKLYACLRNHTSWFVRGIIYTIWAYCWEFSCGFVLTKFDACPWDYTLFDGHFMGLVTLEYAPLWFLGGIVGEQIVVKYALRLHWVHGTNEGHRVGGAPSVNGDVKLKST